MELTATEIQLGPLTLYRHSRELCRDKRKLILEPRIYALLEQLLSSPDHLVSRDHLIATVWQGRVVSESAINRAISQLRKALAELDPENDYIETLPKLGYRLKVMPRLTRPTPQLTNHKWQIMSGALALLAALLWFIIPADAPPRPPSPLLIADKSVHPLTGDDGLEFDVSLSGDGQSVLFHKADNKGRVQLWLQHNQQSSQLSQNPAEHLSAKLSPDGKQAVFVQRHEQDCRVMLADLAPFSSRPLFDCTPDNGIRFAWMPDNKGFYYRYRQDKTQPYAMYLYRLDTGMSRQLTLPANAGNGLGDIAMAVGNEGDSLLVATYQSPQQSILTWYNSQDMQVVSRHELAMGVKDMQWHAASGSVIFSHGAYLYQWTGEQVAPLFYAGQTVQSFALAGQQLIYSDLLQRTGIWQKSLPDGALAAQINSSKLDLLPRVSYDGQQLAFISTRQGKHQIWLQSGHSPARLLADLPAGFTRLSWQLDDSALLYSHQGAVYQVEIHSGQVTQLLPEQTQAYVVNPAADNALLYSSTKSGDWQLWRWHPATGHQQLTEQGGYSGWLFNGKLYFSKFHQPGLWQKRLGAEQETQVIEDFSIINWLNWQVLDGKIAFYRQDQGVFLFDPQTQISTLLMAQQADFIHQYSLTTDRLFFVRADTAQGDLYGVRLSTP
ncbi:hypothetical protein GCM10009092_27630 [Bowmanella denitrificans]|uniref:OmpR/PhoB-type domain-containing protein n=1 Tax=Bowmanella denitrificans TaxID=366582 RepID=A0ABN0XE17_9ALTE